MSLESDRIRGEDAKALLNNRILKEAFAAVGEYLEAQATSCDPDNKDKAARIIISKQLLAGIQREITRVIENGMMADVRLSEIEKRRGLKSLSNADMWQDMGLYWSWRGGNEGYCKPPSEKRIEYSSIEYPGGIAMRLATTVWDNEIPKPVFRDQLEWHRKNGAVIS